jgi:hypothetical protein
METPNKLGLQWRSEIRGAILRLLATEYGGTMVTVGSLSGALAAEGHGVGEAVQMQRHLRYLADQGYIEALQASQCPGYRRDRPHEGTGQRIVVVKLTPLGLQLLDGLAPEDPAVRF